MFNAIKTLIFSIAQNTKLPLLQSRIKCCGQHFPYNNSDQFWFSQHSYQSKL